MACPIRYPMAWHQMIFGLYLTKDGRWILPTGGYVMLRITFQEEPEPVTLSLESSLGGIWVTDSKSVQRPKHLSKEGH